MMVVALFSSCLPARAAKYTNGAVWVTNTTGLTIRVSLAHQWTRGNTMQSAQIGPGGTWHSTVCCFAAGSPYVLVAAFQDNGQEVHRYVDFNPLICLENIAPDMSVPFGFERISINSSNDKVSFVLNDGGHRCPM